MGLVAGTVGVPAGVRDDDDVDQNQEGLVNYRPLQVLQTQKSKIKNSGGFLDSFFLSLTYKKI